MTLELKANRLWCHPTLGSRVLKKKKTLELAEAVADLDQVLFEGLARGDGHHSGAATSRTPPPRAPGGGVLPRQHLRGGWYECGVLL